MRAFPLGNDFSLLSSAWKVNDLWKSNLFQKMASIRRILIYIDLFPEDKKNTYVKMENTNKSSLLQVQFKINKKNNHSVHRFFGAPISSFDILHNNFDRRNPSDKSIDQFNVDGVWEGFPIQDIQLHI